MKIFTYNLDLGSTGKVLPMISVWDAINLIAHHDLQAYKDPTCDFVKGYHTARRELMNEFRKLLKDENGDEESKR